MPSSYFTKPFGLKPTPSVCFPPPPPPPKGMITGSVTIDPNVFNDTTPTVITVDVENALYQTGVPLVSDWNTPHLTANEQLDVFNRTPRGYSFSPITGPGFYTGTVKITWPNGQVRTYPISYTIIP